jgi:Dolichyl-phosphate-mannose-protein mannosyltransferase
MLREALGLDQEAAGGAGGTPPAVAPASWAWLREAALRARDRITGLPSVARRHWLFTAALAAAVVPRVVAMLGFQPAILFKLDTYDYLWGATHLAPNPINPSGYSLFLWLLLPLHSLALVAGIQHVLGLAVAVVIYAVLRRLGVRDWIAVLAAAPVLFSPSQLLLEQLIMADLLALVLMVAGLALLLVADAAPMWRSAVAGLLMGLSVIVRPTSLPLLLLMAGFLLVRRAGWRRVCAVLVAGALPIAGYALWFMAAYGNLNLTNSNGLFLWSRTMSFANCAVIQPPADLQALCPNRQPGRLAEPVPSKRDQPKWYLWNHQIWAWQGTSSSGVVPDVAAFTPAKNARAMRFAERAILAQPLAYAEVVTKDSLLPLAPGAAKQFQFPGISQATSGLQKRNQRYVLAALGAYTGTTKGLGGELGGHFAEQLVQPWARLMRVYQQVIFLPGPLLGLIVIVGLGGLLIPRRRSAAGALLWISALITVVLPIAEHEYNYRYVLPAIPLACMAAALAFARREPVPSAAPPAPAAAAPAPPAPAAAAPAAAQPPAAAETAAEPASPAAAESPAE